MMAIDKTIEGLTAMKAQIPERAVDFVVVNTDGWVTGEIAVRYKTDLIKDLRPDIIFGMQVENELDSLIANVEETPVIMVEPSSSLSHVVQKNAKTSGKCLMQGT
jgi:polynucleotide 5'-kinase involved in rRNA processing